MGWIYEIPRPSRRFKKYVAVDFDVKDAVAIKGSAQKAKLYDESKNNFFL